MTAAESENLKCMYYKLITTLQHCSTAALDVSHRPVHRHTIYTPHLITGQGCYNSATISLVQHQPNKKLLAIKRIHLEMCEIEFSMIVVCPFSQFTLITIYVK